MTREADPPIKIDSVPGAHPGEQILKITGPLVISNFFDFQTMARESKATLLIIDLEGVPYMDSAALGAILGIHVTSTNQGRKYAVINVPQRIQTMFTISGVGDTLVVFPTLAAAEKELL